MPRRWQARGKRTADLLGSRRTLPRGAAQAGFPSLNRGVSPLHVDVDDRGRVVRVVGCDGRDGIGIGGRFGLGLRRQLDFVVRLLFFLITRPFTLPVRIGVSDPRGVVHTLDRLRA